MARPRKKIDLDTYEGRFAWRLMVLREKAGLTVEETFYRMLEILHPAFEKLHQQGGKPLTKLQIEDKLLLTLQYWREYRTMEHLAYEYGLVAPLRQQAYDKRSLFHNHLACQ